MPQNRPSLTSLESRKRLLIEKAETQREQLGCDVQVLQSGLRGLEAQAKFIGSIASVAALAMAGIATFRKAGRTHHNGKSSLLSKALSGGRLASTFWLALRSHRR